MCYTGLRCGAPVWCSQWGSSGGLQWLPCGYWVPSAGFQCGVPMWSPASYSWGPNVDSKVKFHCGAPLWGSTVVLQCGAPVWSSFVRFQCWLHYWLPVCGSNAELHIVQLACCTVYYTVDSTLDPTVGFIEHPTIDSTVDYTGCCSLPVLGENE